jgi:hypothetical protein
MIHHMCETWSQHTWWLCSRPGLGAPKSGCDSDDRMGAHPCYNHTMSRTGTTGGAWRMLRWVWRGLGHHLPFNYDGGRSLSSYDVFYLAIFVRILLYNKDVALIFVPWFIICVRLDPSTYLRCIWNCPRVRRRKVPDMRQMICQHVLYQANPHWRMGPVNPGSRDFSIEFSIVTRVPKRTQWIPHTGVCLRTPVGDVNLWSWVRLHYARPHNGP